MHPRIERSEIKGVKNGHQMAHINPHCTIYVAYALVHGFFRSTFFLKKMDFSCCIHITTSFTTRMAANKRAPCACAELESILNIALEMFE